jgi:hypothetical protein
VFVQDKKTGVVLQAADFPWRSTKAAKPAPEPSDADTRAVR